MPVTRLMSRQNTSVSAPGQVQTVTDKFSTLKIHSTRSAARLMNEKYDQVHTIIRKISTLKAKMEKARTKYSARRIHSKIQDLQEERVKILKSFKPHEALDLKITLYPWVDRYGVFTHIQPSNDDWKVDIETDID